MEMTPLLTPKQVAEKLNVCRTLVYDLLDSGELDSIRVGVKARRVPADALTDYVERLRTNAIVAAHKRARTVLKDGPGDFPIGLTLAMSDIVVHRERRCCAL